eukprot:4288835-Pyramimonas_sp.AAC.1
MPDQGNSSGHRFKIVESDYGKSKNIRSHGNRMADSVRCPAGVVHYGEWTDKIGSDRCNDLSST